MRHFVRIKSHPPHFFHCREILGQVLCPTEKPLRHLQPSIIFGGNHLRKTQLDRSVHFTHPEQATISHTKFFAQLRGDDNRSPLAHLKEFVRHNVRISEFQNF